ncbi:MAG TPA: hypothetical protein VIH58_01445 [Chthoniobacterales bacterium]
MVIRFANLLSQRILKEWAAIFSNPFLFLIFLSEKRASEIIESKIQSLFQRGALMRYSLGDQNPADASAASEKLPFLPHMKPNREKIEAEELVKERLPLTKWELTPKEKEDFNRVMRLMFDAASILRYDLELGEDAIGKTLKELADWATN